MLPANEIKQGLGQFHGTENYWKGHYPNLVYTDGVKFLFESAKCYWIFDIIASVQTIPEVKKEYFQAWTLKVENGSAIITATDGNEKEIYRQELGFTDFPLSDIKLYAIDDTVRRVVLLTNEY